MKNVITTGSSNGFGLTWGTDKINELTQPIQDNILKEMQLDSVLGGVSV